MSSDINWEEINEKLPFERTDDAKEKRRELFKQFDPNGNGYLSLAEVSRSEMMNNFQN
jgi:Ca2+-binding EF-hand superfamily protein